MVRVRRTALLVLLSVVLFSCSIPAFPSCEIDPRALGRGTAYTALAEGSLAPFWNPAGATAAPGVHGAFAAGLSPNGTLLLLGAAIAAANSPTVIWNMAQNGNEGEILGTFAFFLFPRTALGGGVSYAFSDEPEGISFHIGFLHREPHWKFGASLSHLGAGIFCAALPLQFRAGGALYTLPGVTLTLDLHLSPAGSRVAIGGAAQIWRVKIRWGTAVLLTGGFDRVGIGVGFNLFDLPIDLAIGVVGNELSPCASLGIEAAIPAWW
jgi:hypothetical protein